MVFVLVSGVGWTATNRGERARTRPVCYRNCYRWWSASDDVDDVIGDVGHGVRDRELDHRLPAGAARPWVVRDPLERLRPASASGPGMDGAAVDARELHLLAVALEEARSVDREDVMGPVAVGRCIAEAVEPVGRQLEEDPTVEGPVPGRLVHSDERPPQDRLVDRLVVPDGCCSCTGWWISTESGRRLASSSARAGPSTSNRSRSAVVDRRPCCWIEGHDPASAM